VSGLSTATLLERYRAFYADEPFVHVSDAPPPTKAALTANTAHVTVRFDERTGTVLAIGVIDNLVKGASGQALQCANLLLGLPETTGLAAVGTYP
jgi:N-acetyl-gamma-glutamyl-phosphate reductase